MSNHAYRATITPVDGGYKAQLFHRDPETDLETEVGNPWLTTRPFNSRADARAAIESAILKHEIDDAGDELFFDDAGNEIEGES